MQWADLPLKPTSRMLRQFAGLWCLFMSGLAAWQWLGHDRPLLALGLLLLGVVIGGAGLLRPSAIRPLFIGCMVAAFPIGWTVSRLILALIFYGLFTPIGLIFRLMGRDVLQLRRPADRETYWQPKPMTTEPNRYFRQY